jgi:hypothetical protein
MTLSPRIWQKRFRTVMEWDHEDCARKLEAGILRSHFDAAYTIKMDERATKLTKFYGNATNGIPRDKVIRVHGIPRSLLPSWITAVIPLFFFAVNPHANSSITNVGWLIILLNFLILAVLFSSCHWIYKQTIETNSLSNYIEQVLAHPRFSFFEVLRVCLTFWVYLNFSQFIDDARP